MSLRVAVDLLYYTGRKGGTESYARGLFAALAGHDDLTFVGLGNAELRRDPPDWFPGEIVALPVSGENRVGWAAAEALAVGPVARRVGVDLLHCPSNFGPAVRLLPTVVTVHDILAERHPEWVPEGRARGVRLLHRATVRAADHVVSVSRATANDLHQLLGVPVDKVTVVPPGVEVTARADRRVADDRPFLLTGGNRMPHKNFEGLLHAWALLPNADRPKLVVTGGRGVDPLGPLVRELGLEHDVELRDWVDTAELEDLYRRATAYVFPTLFEGFGLPVLEAMARGCPVVGSDIPVLREVGGEAMVYADPHNPASLAEAVRKVTAEADLRDRLAEAGRARASDFTWPATARSIAAIYRSVVLA
ncbi:glycosyltransferase family 4 protein [Pseudonocardia kujensis]|uniref:glycosyltransferase family 4 protein n=1 Tax=Pseudonocardia kujensis TaxID=1128675 RepID=UPI001E51854C|nr:glycosyltransferase family 1 protein [Pseudonocardia kujensis]MCE0761786.1 glycosyltransferase family 4 protein [Pseudonocardia kujensis]